MRAGDGAGPVFITVAVGAAVIGVEGVGGLGREAEADRGRSTRMVVAVISPVPAPPERRAPGLPRVGATNQQNQISAK